MKKHITLNNTKSLEEQLKSMRSEMRERENSILTDTKIYVSELPKRIFIGNVHKNPLPVTNPLGKFLAKAVNKTVLKKQGFVTKFIAGLILRKVGKKAETKVLAANAKHQVR